MLPCIRQFLKLQEFFQNRENIPKMPRSTRCLLEWIWFNHTSTKIQWSRKLGAWWINIITILPDYFSRIQPFPIITIVVLSSKWLTYPFDIVVSHIVFLPIPSGLTWKFISFGKWYAFTNSGFEQLGLNFFNKKHEKLHRNFRPLFFYNRSDEFSMQDKLQKIFTNSLQNESSDRAPASAYRYNYQLSTMEL
jgi:hypothetical protein